MSTDFSKEYDLSALEKVRPQGHDFELWTTPRYRHHYVQHAYEPMSARLLVNVARSHDLFIDVGAHYGFYTVLIARTLPDLSVVAFEPVPENFAILEENLRLNGLHRVEALRVAASETAGTRTFQLAEASDSCSFYPHDQAPNRGSIEVCTDTLDAVLSRHPQARSPLIKIDTEGHELAVLDGLAQALEAAPLLRLLVELNPAMLERAGHTPDLLLTRLRESGFGVYFLDEESCVALASDDPAHWRSLLAGRSYVNLYCSPSRTTRSICFFSHSAKLEGAERNLLELVTELVRDQGAVCTVALPENGPLRGRLEKVGAAIIDIPYGWWCDLAPAHDRETPLRLINSLDCLLSRGLEELERIQPDVVVTLTMVIPWGAVAAACLGKPHIWFVCEFGELDHGLQFFFPLDRILDTIKRSSAHLFTVSEAVRAALFPDLDNATCSPLYPYIELPDVTSDLEVNPFRRPGATRLGIFGAINPTKGQETAIRAVRDLVRQSYHVELLLAGHANPRYLAALKSRIREEGLEEHVSIPGFLEEPLSVMAATDIVVVTSRREAFGRVAVEAALLNKPVVVPDSGGIVEAVEEGVTGLTYPTGDASALANRLEKLLNDPELRQRLGEQARQLAHRRFTRESFGGKLYSAILSASDDAPPFPPQLIPLLPVLISNLKGSVAELNHGVRGEREASQRYVLQLEEEIGALHRQQSEVNAYVTHLEAEIAAQQQEAERCREYALHLEGQLLRQSRQASGRASDESFRQHIVRLESLLDERRLVQEESQQHITRLKGLLADLRKQIEESHRRIAHLENELQVRPTWEEIQAQESELREVRAVYEEARQYCAELQADLNMKQKTEDETGLYVAKLEREIEAYRQEQNQARRFMAQLESLLHTVEIVQQKEGSPEDGLVPESVAPTHLCAVIVHHMGVDLLDRCVRSLLLSQGVSVEIVVVDNACPEALPKVVNEPTVHVVRSERPLGFSAANNLGAAWARKYLPGVELFFFVNNDTVIPPKTLWSLTHELADHPQCGIVGPRLMIWRCEGYLNSLELNVTELGEAWDEGIGIHLKDYGPLPPSREVLAVTGSALLIRATTLEKIRGWSEFFGYYYEDIDLCLKARRLGWTVRQVPEAVIDHAISATSDRIPDFKRLLSWRNQFVLLATHWPSRLAFRVLPRIVARELYSLCQRLRVKAYKDARLQVRAWLGALTITPQAWAGRLRNGSVIDWTRWLKPAGTVPAIRLPDQQSEIVPKNPDRTP